MLDLAGRRYGMLVAVRRAGHNAYKNVLWECRCDCGAACVRVATNLKTGRVKSCGCLRHASRPGAKGPNSPRWRGGRKLTTQGYVLKYAPRHPQAAAHHGFVLEHRLVMESHLMRNLHPGETVHHKNGNKQDNRLANLELWGTSHAGGQRVEDQVTWARAILEQYAPEYLAPHAYAVAVG